MAYCTTCNSLRPEGLPTNKPSDPKALKSFGIEETVANIKSTASHGCKGCQLILQATRCYVGPKALDNLSTDLWDDRLIRFESNCNEPLIIDLAGLRMSYKEKLGRDAVLELFEEDYDESSENRSPLFAAIGYGTNPPEVLALESAAETSARWIRACDDQHQCYPQDEPPPLPTRILEVEKNGGIKLIATDSSSRGRYVALSYCWGGNGNATTTSKNLHERMAGIQESSLPNLIRGVVHFTRLIGVRYLWIDALCIIQDDRVDWRRESARMADLYAGAYFTIAADAAASTAHKLTGPRNIELREEMSSAHGEWVYPIVAREKVHKVNKLAEIAVNGHDHRFFGRERYSHWDTITGMSDFQHRNSPLNRRGWAMQEKLLSRRILHFGSFEMTWECKNSANCECGGISHDDPRANYDTPIHAFERAEAALKMQMTLPREQSTTSLYVCNPDFVAAWVRLAAMFTNRQLTQQTDKLPAMSALAQRLSEGKVYLAGLWLENLPWYLAWKPMESTSEDYEMEPCTGPSWSWISNAHIVGWSAWTHQAKTLITILDASTNFVGHDRFGEVNGGMIRLRGRVAHGKLHKAPSKQPSMVTNHGAMVEFFGDGGSRPEESSKRQSQNCTIGQRNIRHMAPGADLWFIVLFNDIVEQGRHRIKKKCHWILIAARPSRASIRAVVPDSVPLQDTLVGERVGFIDSRFQEEDERASTSEWLNGPDFEEKEMVLI